MTEPVRRELDRHQLAATAQHLDTVAEELYDRAAQERDVHRRNTLLCRRARLSRLARELRELGE